MTVTEFFGCTFLAFGPPLAMFIFTIACDPVRIIILIAAAFFWLLALLLSSLLWFIVVPLRNKLIFGVVFSVLFQEAFRYITYRILRKAEGGLKKITDDNNAQITENKHILAYVSGLGFGIISGAFSLVNVVADAVGPATMGLKQGSDMFFITSAATSLCFILLHTFWSVIFFNALDNKIVLHVVWVVGTHMFVSCLTLVNYYEMYAASLVPAYIVMVLTGLFSFKIVGGSLASFKACIKAN